MALLTSGRCPPALGAQQVNGSTGDAAALPVVPTATDRAPIDPKIHKTAPMTSKMVPIVHRIAILATKPMMSRINPRMSMLLAPPTFTATPKCVGELAERTVIVPTLECQPRQLDEPGRVAAA
jgi:hypothetical protein